MAESCFYGLAVAAGTRLLWKLWRDTNVEFGGVGISRPTLFGCRRLAWCDIIEYAFVECQACGIYSARSGFVIHFYVYADPNAVSAYLRAKAGQSEASSVHRLKNTPAAKTLAIW